MGRYFIIILSLLCIIMSLTIAMAQSADVKGWGNTTWGMSEDKIIKLYPGIKRLSENRLSLPNVVIGMSKYDVILVTNNRKNLKEVIVTASGLSGLLTSDKNLILESQFAELEKELSLKYGPPVYHNRPPSSVANEAVSTWTFPSTTIELNYLLMRGFDDKTNVNHLIIRYRPNVSKDNL